MTLQYEIEMKLLNNVLISIRQQYFTKIFLMCVLTLMIAYSTVFISDHMANADTVVDTIPVGRSPQGIAFNPYINKMYVANHGDPNCDPIIAQARTSSIYVIDVNNDVQTVNGVSEDCLTDVAFNDLNKRMYVTTGGDDSVIVIDGLSVVGTIGVDDNPQGIAFNPTDNRIYSANHDDNDVSVISDFNVEGEIEFDNTLPIGLAFNPTNNRIYVTNSGTGSVSTIDTNGGSVTIPGVGDFPYGIAFNPANNRMYITNQRADSVTMMDGFNIVGQAIRVGDAPTGIAYNPTNNRMYVTNQGDDTVAVIDESSNTVRDVIRVGDAPTGIAYNPTNNRMYVTNSGDNTVSVIDANPQASRLLARNNTAICPEDFVQHWDKIKFMINSSELAQRVNLTANTELDIKVLDDPRKVVDVKQEVLDYLGMPNATKDAITIVDVDYAIICASSSTLFSTTPTVEIISPANQSQFSPQQTIIFRGQAQDAEDGQLTGASLEWHSDRDGLLGTGNEINVALSGPPTPCMPEFIPHSITLTAKDSDGNSSIARIVVLIGIVC